MQTNLYSLPKDILVKLITTIRDDITKEYMEKYGPIIDFLNNASNNILVYRCAGENCFNKYFSTYHGRDNETVLNWNLSEPMIWCENQCITDVSGPYCVNCADKYLINHVIREQTLLCCPYCLIHY